MCETIKRNRVGNFFKVSKNQFAMDIRDNDTLYHAINSYIAKSRNLFEYDEIIDELYDNIKLPERKTSKSAGYDFFFPYPEIVVKPGQSVKIPTGIKVEIDDNWFLAEVPRSSLGFKYRMQMDNTIGIIDADYFNNESNEGHIFVKVHNDNKEGKDIILERHNAYCQGIFLPFGITYNDNAEGIRVGGIGSTGK